MLGGHFGASQTPHLGKEGRVSHLHQLMVNAPPALSPRSPEVLLSQLTDTKQIEGYQALL